MYTLVEYMKTVQDPLLAGFIETMYLEETFMQYLPFRDIAGLALAFAREKTLPSIGFRNLNEAFSESTGELERKVEALRIFGADSDTDRELVKAYGNGERVARDSMTAKAMAMTFVQYFLYGNSGSRTGNAYDDVKAFDGLETVCASGQKVDGGGSTGSDGSAIFAIRFGAGWLQGLQLAPGLEVRNLGELETKPAFRTRADWTSGYALYNDTAIAWMYDLTVAAKPTAVKMDQLRDKIPGGPDIYLMSKRSRRDLQSEMLGSGVLLQTTLDAVGRAIPAYGDVPIVISEAIIDTESVP